MTTKQEFHIHINADGKTAVDWLAEESGLSRQKLKQYMQKGSVWLEHVKDDVSEIDPSDEKIKATQQGYIQRLRRAKKVVDKNDILHFYYDESILIAETDPAVLVEDLGDYSIWNKPSGMLSQGSKWGDHCTIYRWVEKHLQPERPAFIVHRLDRAANGLIILAHKKGVASQLSKMFEERQIDKYYRVDVKGDFSSMVSSDESKDGVLIINEDIDGKVAISHVTMITFNETETTSTLEVKIETGRKHQIRKHLSKLGFPVVGDRLYGGDNDGIDIDHTNEVLEGSSDDKEPEMVDLQLQAYSLKFICPLTQVDRVFTLDS